MRTDGGAEEVSAAAGRPAVAPLAGDTARLEFRDAMARLTSAVTIVTTDGPAGCTGFTASAVASVTDQPPTLLVCLNRTSSPYDAVRANGVVCVNVLTAEDEGLSRLFGGGTPPEERFSMGIWVVTDSGAPCLESALVSFDCRISSTIAVSTHDILICEVQAIRRADRGGALAYFNRRFHHLQCD